MRGKFDFIVIVAEKQYTELPDWTDPDGKGINASAVALITETTRRATRAPFSSSTHKQPGWAESPTFRVSAVVRSLWEGGREEETDGQAQRWSRSRLKRILRELP